MKFYTRICCIAAPLVGLALAGTSGAGELVVSFISPGVVAYGSAPMRKCNSPHNTHNLVGYAEARNSSGAPVCHVFSYGGTAISSTSVSSSYSIPSNGSDCTGAVTMSVDVTDTNATTNPFGVREVGSYPGFLETDPVTLYSRRYDASLSTCANHEYHATANSS